MVKKSKKSSYELWLNAIKRSLINDCARAPGDVEIMVSELNSELTKVIKEGTSWLIAARLVRANLVLRDSKPAVAASAPETHSDLANDALRQVVDRYLHADDDQARAIVVEEMRQLLEETGCDLQIDPARIRDRIAKIKGSN